MPEPVLVDVGWRNCTPQAALAFFPPEPIGEAAAEELARFLPYHGPGNDLARRIVQVHCPFNARIQLGEPSPGQFGYRLVPETGSITMPGFRGLINHIVPSALRTPDTPAVQISLNLMIVTEERCSLQLMPPFLAPQYRDWPGTVISGRFPVRDWPRPLNCILEWEDRDRDWVLRRGDPLAYLMFEFDDPAKLPRMVEAALTAPLKRHFAQVESAANFARNVRPMFKEAAERRPARLLTPKRTGCPDFS